MRLVLSTWLAFTCVPGFGWGDLGHETVGEIAERLLSPQAKQLVRGAIGVEPLAVAATFADKVRNDPRFDRFVPYHFINAQLDYSYQPVAGSKDASAILKLAPRILTQKSVPHATRQLLFRYLVHVVGDMHQPLHTSFREDQGGNACVVQWQPDPSIKAQPTQLHKSWDHFLPDSLEPKWKALGGTGWFFYSTLADYLFKQAAHHQIVLSADEAKKPVVEPETWLQESILLLPSIYPDPKPITDPLDRTYCKMPGAKFDPATAPILGPKYVQKAQPIVEKRLLLAGLRLAQMLHGIALQADKELLSSKSEESLLSAAELLN